MYFSSKMVICLAAALYAPHVFAISEARANVPFAFSVKGQLFSPGFYDISMDSSNSFIILRSCAHPSKMITALVRPIDSADTGVVLRFHVIGTSHFLERIQIGMRSTANLIRQNKRASPPT